MVAKGNSLAEILDSLCRLVEAQPGEVLASILLVDGNHLRHGGGPSLPKAYTDVINGIMIGPSAGSCGTAAYRGEPVIAEDIATDPLWADYRDLALPHSLRACWSTPVFSSHGNVIKRFRRYSGGQMSVQGQERRFGDVRATSALPPKTDIHREGRHVSKVNSEVGKLIRLSRRRGRAAPAVG
jgi:hypothetical protein